MRKLKALQAKCLVFRIHFLLLMYKGKAAGKHDPITSREGPEGNRWCWWLTPGLSRFTPGEETWYQLCRRLAGPQGRSGRVRKTLHSPGFDLRTVQFVASRYTVSGLYTFIA